MPSVSPVATCQPKPCACQDMAEYTYSITDAINHTHNAPFFTGPLFDEPFLTG